MATTNTPVQGPARTRLDARDVGAFQASLVVDSRRRRPLYFDGRFLAARDLVREQNYFLTRQSDLGRAGGFGVVEGLYVQGGAGSPALTVTAGHGITPAGELVVIPQDFSVDLVNVPEIQRLNAAFGLMERPHEAPRNRTGLFVVALRPVEFTANPVASYPTSITGNRSVEDGEIIEGAVVTLIPYPDEGPDLTTNMRRARVAHEVFVGGTGKGAAAGALPLAMVSLNRGTVEWLDVFMVRREVGSEQGDIIGLGFAPRALREAHLLQYEAHLREVLLLRQSLGYRFAASEYFMALPPAGRLPAAAVDPADFSQLFFPATVDVDLSIIPEDEIPALVEESMTLPPIDLTRTADELDSTSVVIVIPVPRNELRTISTDVSTLSRSLKPAAPGMVAKRTPLEHLRGVRLPGNFVPLPAPGQAEDEAWKQLLGRGGMLWYIRRKTLHQRADLAGERELLTALQPPTSDRESLAERERVLDQRQQELEGRMEVLAKREREVTTREQRVEQMEEHLNTTLRQRSEQLTARENDVGRREELVKKVELELTSREKGIAPRESALSAAEAELRKRDQALLGREAEVKKREDAVAGREITVGGRETEAANRLSVAVSRENSVTQREVAVKQREDAVAGRETRVIERETGVKRREDAVSSVESDLRSISSRVTEHDISHLPAYKQDQIRGIRTRHQP